ncbi:hypothetical protein SPBRAN_238 [uncultured Candidatus Thioglobus sp.]|nr:hypothetical protein SPBRAN_238 [uncultured Candidatus Thioglobus sp.]
MTHTKHKPELKSTNCLKQLSGDFLTTKTPVLYGGIFEM